MMVKENLLDLVAYHEKWHADVQAARQPYLYNTNDFLIEEIFKRLQVDKGVFVEFGAWDGIYLSNTRQLFQNGWSGLLIEGDEERYQHLEKNYRDAPRVATVKAFVNTDDILIDDIFEKHLNANIDFCSIDIDGLDLDIFETFKTNLPKVVCIEGGQVLHPEAPRVSREIAADNIQQSLRVMTSVFESKGYRLLCTYQDAFFIKHEYFNLFNVEENLMNQYIDGLIALPRLPYLIKLLDSHGLSNMIIDSAVADIPASILKYVITQGDKKAKMMWVNDFYGPIKQKLEELKEKL